MGTRSLTIVKDGNNKLVTIYQQYDGYPSGVGAALKDILYKGKSKLVNGFSGGDKNPKIFNGMGCLAAHLVHKLKDGIGNVYIEKNSIKHDEVDFTYTIFNRNKELHISVKEVYENKELYKGPLNEFKPETLEE